jgi:hypothetical protein
MMELLRVDSKEKAVSKNKRGLRSDVVSVKNPGEMT